jgi:hypothetical protein
LRASKCARSSDGSVISGKSQTSSGRMTREVFDAEKFADEAKRIRQAQATTGP